MTVIGPICFGLNTKRISTKRIILFFGILLMNKGVITEEYDWANTLDYSKISAEVFDTAFFTLNFLCNNRERKRVLKLVFNAIKWRSLL